MSAAPRTVIPTAVILLWVAAAGAEEMYRNEARHFSMDVPDGWEVMPPQVLAAANESGRDLAGPHYAAYLAGLRRRADPPQPIILIQFEPANLRSKSPEELEKRLTDTLNTVVRQAKGMLSDLGRDMSGDEVVLDWPAKRFIVRTRMSAGGMTAAGYSVGVIGRDGIVLLHCYTLHSELRQWLPTFHAVADSVRFDPGYQFDPPQASATDLVFGVLGGVALVAVVAAGIALRRRLRRRLPPPTMSAGDPPCPAT